MFYDDDAEKLNVWLTVGAREIFVSYIVLFRDVSKNYDL